MPPLILTVAQFGKKENGQKNSEKKLSDVHGETSGVYADIAYKGQNQINPLKLVHLKQQPSSISV